MMKYLMWFPTGPVFSLLRTEEGAFLSIPAEDSVRYGEGKGYLSKEGSPVDHYAVMAVVVWEDGVQNLYRVCFLDSFAGPITIVKNHSEIGGTELLSSTAVKAFNAWMDLRGILRGNRNLLARLHAGEEVQVK